MLFPRSSTPPPVFNLRNLTHRAAGQLCASPVEPLDPDTPADTQPPARQQRASRSRCCGTRQPPPRTDTALPCAPNQKPNRRTSLLPVCLRSEELLCSDWAAGRELQGTRGPRAAAARQSGVHTQFPGGCERDGLSTAVSLGNV